MLTEFVWPDTSGFMAEILKFLSVCVVSVECVHPVFSGDSVRAAVCLA